MADRSTFFVYIISPYDASLCLSAQKCSVSAIHSTHVPLYTYIYTLAEYKWLAIWWNLTYKLVTATWRVVCVCIPMCGGGMKIKADDVNCASGLKSERVSTSGSSRGFVEKVVVVAAAAAERIDLPHKYIQLSESVQYARESRCIYMCCLYKREHRIGI